MQERVVFAQYLQSEPPENVIFMDECSLELWRKPARTWFSNDNQVIAPLNSKKLQNLTIYGAVGLALIKPVFMQGEATNHKLFSAFLKEIRDHLQIPFNGNKLVLVLDNHPAHRKKEALDVLNQWFIPKFQPAYSSQFNPQETVWSVLKRQFYQQLYRRETDLKTQAEFKAMVTNLTDNICICVPTIIRVNKHYVDFHADL